MDGSSDAALLDDTAMGWLTRSLRQLVPRLRCHIFQNVDASDARVVAVKSEHSRVAFVTRATLLGRSKTLLRNALVTAGWLK